MYSTLDSNGPAKDELTHIFSKLKTKSTTCFDCNHASPTWASISNGIYLCISCSGQHRHLGVHLSFVRSTTLDTWTWEQLRRMKCSGMGHFLKDQLQTVKGDLQQKYSSPMAIKWRKTLDDLVEQDKMNFPDSFELDNQLQSPVDRKKSEDFFNSFSEKSEAPVWDTEETWEDTPAVVQETTPIVPTISIVNKKGKLGTKKVINLDEAEQRAKQLQHIQQQQQQAKSIQQTPVIVPTIISNSNSNFNKQSTLNKPQKPVEMDEVSERLGIGFKKLSTAPIQQKQTAHYSNYQDSDDAQRRFKNSKSISSDQYHNNEPIAVLLNLCRTQFK